MTIYSPIYRVDYPLISSYCENHFKKIRSNSTLDDIPENKTWIPTQPLGGRADKVGSDIRFKVVIKRKGLYLKVRVSNIQFNVFALLLNCVVGFLGYALAQSFFHFIYSSVFTLILYYIYRVRIYSSILEFTMTLEKKVIQEVKNQTQNHSIF